MPLSHISLTGHLFLGSELRLELTRAVELKSDQPARPRGSPREPPIASPIASRGPRPPCDIMCSAQCTERSAARSLASAMRTNEDSEDQLCHEVRRARCRRTEPAARPRRPRRAARCRALQLGSRLGTRAPARVGTVNMTKLMTKFRISMTNCSQGGGAVGGPHGPTTFSSGPQLSLRAASRARRARPRPPPPQKPWPRDLQDTVYPRRQVSTPRVLA